MSVPYQREGPGVRYNRTRAQLGLTSVESLTGHRERARNRVHLATIRDSTGGASHDLPTMMPM